MDTYQLYAFCDNCYFKGQVTIPQAEDFKSWAASNSCPTCKCYRLRKDSDQSYHMAATVRQRLGYDLPVGSAVSSMTPEQMERTTVALDALRPDTSQSF